MKHTQMKHIIQEYVYYNYTLLHMPRRDKRTYASSAHELHTIWLQFNEN